MVNINLLPWRRFSQEQQRRKHKKIILIAVGVVVLLFVLCHIGLIVLETNIHSRINYWHEQCALFSPQAKKASQLKKQYQKFHDATLQIKHSEKDQLELLVFFNELLQSTPADIFYKKLTHRAHKIVLIGNSRSALALLELVKRFNSNVAGQKAQIIEITQQPSSMDVVFKLQVTHND